MSKKINKDELLHELFSIREIIFSYECRNFLAKIICQNEITLQDMALAIVKSGKTGWKETICKIIEVTGNTPEQLDLDTSTITKLEKYISKKTQSKDNWDNTLQKIKKEIAEFKTKTAIHHT